MLFFLKNNFDKASCSEPKLAELGPDGCIPRIEVDLSINGDEFGWQGVFIVGGGMITQFICTLDRISLRISKADCVVGGSQLNPGYRSGPSHWCDEESSVDLSEIQVLITGA